MKRKLLLVLLIMLGLFTITGCTKKEARQSAIDFKNEYEALNGKPAKGDKIYRTLNISDQNPFIKTTDTDILDKIHNKETFYVYIGDPLCPWCRSGLEKFTNVSIKRKIQDIYYIDFWDDDHNEILRDLYELDDSNKEISFKLTREGNPAYMEILEYVNDFAQDYTITKDDTTYNIGEKRLYGGDVFFFKDGKAVKYVSMRSDKLEGAFDELSDEVLKDQEDKFNEFFNN